MTIGIDINNVIRDINKQVLKYYEKEFHTEVILDKHYLQIPMSELVPFKNKIDANKFFYEDYPFEIFGCATTLEMDLIPLLNEWYEKMTNKGYDIFLFSTKEHNLSIQSTYFFLSKVGCQIRNVQLFADEKEVNNKCDVIITANPKILKAKKNNLIGIKYDYNINECKNISAYSSLKEIMQKHDFSIYFNNENNLLHKLKNIWKKIMK